MLWVVMHIILFVVEMNVVCCLNWFVFDLRLIEYFLNLFFD